MTFHAGQPKHYAYIDSLRGLAVCGVILVHAALFFPVSGITAKLAEQGGTGVQLFFTVSALTLMLSMASRSAKEKRPLGNFFIRRFFRIAPAYYVFLGIYLVVYGLGPRAYAPRGVTPVAVWSTVLFVNGWRPDTINVPVSGEWSIAVEMSFYLVLPILFQWIRSFRVAAVGWVLSLACWVLLNPLTFRIGDLSGYPARSYLVDWFGSMWFPSQLPVFLSGICLYFAIREGISIRLFTALSLAGGVLVAALSIGFKMPGKSAACGLAFSVVAFVLSRFPFPMLVNPWFEYMGKISFSAYLVHAIVIDSLRPLFDSIAIPNALLRLIIVYAASLLATAVAATLVWRTIEVPFQQLGKWLVGQNERRAMTTLRAAA